MLLVTRPVVVMTDGHSSRFDLEVLRFCDGKQIFQFLPQPDTSADEDVKHLDQALTKKLF